MFPQKKGNKTNMKKKLFIIPLIVGAMLTSCAESIDPTVARERANEISAAYNEAAPEVQHFRMTSSTKMTAPMKMTQKTVIELSAVDKYAHVTSSMKSDTGNYESEATFWKDGDVYHFRASSSGDETEPSEQSQDYSSFSAEAEARFNSIALDDILEMFEESLGALSEIFAEYENPTSLLAGYLPEGLSTDSLKTGTSFHSNGEGSLIFDASVKGDIQMDAGITGLNLGFSYSIKAAANFTIENYLPTKESMSLKMHDNNAKADLINVSNEMSINYGEFTPKLPKA